MTEPTAVATGGSANVPTVGARRMRTAAYSLLTAGSLTAVAGANATWRRTVGELGQEVTRTGADATGTLALILAGVLAAGTLLMLTLRTRGRRLLTLPLALVAIAMVMLGVAQVGEPGATWLPIAYSVAGLVALAGVAVVAATAHRWPAPADRFSRRARRAGTRADDDPADVWRALDEGHDPTENDDSAGNRRRDRPE
ncbi:Trp biosynthesis-associated membrane protein [Mariniluteicoccus flavus]